ncbi:MAG: DNA alkylation repair protein [Enhygromyxa sp.]
MSVTKVLEQLRALGTIEARLALVEHGAREPMFGVRFGDLDALAQRHRGDHELACALWTSENIDARLLAMKIADPERMSEVALDRWLGDLRWHMSVDLFVSALVVRSRHAHQKAEQWREAPGELEGRAGWTLVVHLARDLGIPDPWFAGCVDELVAGIHSAPNYKREAMNSALIAIGGYRENLRARALRAADRIGTVEVDHGDNYCETPDARRYIEAMIDRSERGRRPRRGAAR